VNGARILLARRASGSDHAVRFEPDGLCIEGGFALRRRLPYRSVVGLERAGAWLWLGTGVLPVGLGGRDVPAAQLDAVEAELRARIAALPDGARRLARLDARRSVPVRPPWLTLALGAALASALAATGTGRLDVATHALFLLAFGLLAECRLGARPALAAAAAAGLAAGLAEPPSGAAGFAACVAHALPAGWIGLVAFARALREPGLSVRARSALELVAPLALAFAAHGAASGASALALGLAALAGFAVAPLVLRQRSP
jgi:hypothetical protein